LIFLTATSKAKINLKVISGRYETQEKRERQSKLIKTWKPWEQSTGAKTKEGKARSAQNALKHGFRSREQIESRKQINELIRQSGETTEKTIYLGLLLSR